MNHELHFNLDTVARSVVIAQRLAGLSSEVEIHLGEAEGGVSWILYEIDGRPILNIEDWGVEKRAYLMGSTVKATSYPELVEKIEGLLDGNLQARKPLLTE